ncbi:MAG: hypothetical protein KF830_09390 [Planctomycetes bacterium]|nr:hypothetical protein [Planctomycetota bacterium]
MTGRDDELARLAALHAAAPDHSSAAAAARRRTVLEWHAAGRLATAAARCTAAHVLLAGGSLAEVEAAQALALLAMPHERAARRLAAAACDRLRQLQGRPQKFGTQTMVREGRVELWPVEPATTDSERAKWDVEPLAELRRRAGQLAPEAGPWSP